MSTHSEPIQSSVLDWRTQNKSNQSYVIPGEYGREEIRTGHCSTSKVMGNFLGYLWSASTDTTFYALVPPDVFDTEHWVYVECERIALDWHVRPIPSGRTVASMHVQPNLLSASVKPCMIVSSFRERIVSKSEADAGAATYILSYVCFALAGAWNYGFVTGSQWRETTGDELVIKTDTGAVIIPLNDPTLIVLTLTGYALRPFAALPLASHPVTRVQTDTATIVDHFLANGRHAALDYVALDLLSAHLSPPPATNMLLPCILLDGTQCEISVAQILGVARATFQRQGREDTRSLRRPVAGVVRPRDVDDTTELGNRCRHSYFC